MVYFPAGLCSRRNGGVICDLEWKKNFVQKAVESGRDIVPVFVDAVNSQRFYRAASLRKSLGIPVNLELVLLPDELFRKKGSAIGLRFGEPVSHSSLRGGAMPPRRPLNSKKCVTICEDEPKGLS